MASDITTHDAVLLLEFVDGIAAEHWSIGDYREAARCLGAVEARERLRFDPWLSQQFIRDCSYGGTERIDATFLFRERGLALEFSLNRALMALDHP